MSSLDSFPFKLVVKANVPSASSSEPPVLAQMVTLPARSVEIGVGVIRQHELHQNLFLVLRVFQEAHRGNFDELLHRADRRARFSGRTFHRRRGPAVALAVKIVHRPIHARHHADNATAESTVASQTGNPGPCDAG